MTAAAILLLAMIWWDDLNQFCRDIHRIADHFDPAGKEDAEDEP